MSSEEIEEFEVDGEKVRVVRDFVFLGAKIEDSGSCKGGFFETIGIRQRGNDRAKQDMERQRYDNYNKIQNSKCISFPSIYSSVWL